MAAEEKWYFTKEQLANTPSRKSGYDSDKELSCRQQAANFIQDMGQRLLVTQLCINTAIVYMHRFYMFHSFTRFHRNAMAAAALFLAAKVEEQPRKLEHVIKVAQICLHREQPPPDVRSEVYIEQAQELVVNENILLQTLGFDVAIDHPHTHVVRCCHLVRASKDLAQTSYFMASNSLHLTTMCLQYKPTVVACFCIHLACKWSNWEIPQSTEGKPWFWYVDKSVSQELLEQLTEEFLAIFDKCPSRLKKKITSLSSTQNPAILSAFTNDGDKKRNGESSSGSQGTLNMNYSGNANDDMKKKQEYLRHHPEFKKHHMVHHSRGESHNSMSSSKSSCMFGPPTRPVQPTAAATAVAAIATPTATATATSTSGSASASSTLRQSNNKSTTGGNSGTVEPPPAGATLGKPEHLHHRPRRLDTDKVAKNHELLASSQFKKYDKVLSAAVGGGGGASVSGSGAVSDFITTSNVNNNSNNSNNSVNSSSSGHSNHQHHHGNNTGRGGLVINNNNSSSSSISGYLNSGYSAAHLQPTSTAYSHHHHQQQQPASSSHQPPIGSNHQHQQLITAHQPAPINTVDFNRLTALETTATALLNTNTETQHIQPSSYLLSSLNKHQMLSATTASTTSHKVKSPISSQTQIKVERSIFSPEKSISPSERAHEVHSSILVTSGGHKKKPAEPNVPDPVVTATTATAIVTAQPKQPNETFKAGTHLNQYHHATTTTISNLFPETQTKSEVVPVTVKEEKLPSDDIINAHEEHPPPNLDTTNVGKPLVNLPNSSSTTTVTAAATPVVVVSDEIVSKEQKKKKKKHKEHKEKHKDKHKHKHKNRDPEPIVITIPKEKLSLPQQHQQPAVPEQAAGLLKIKIAKDKIATSLVPPPPTTGLKIKIPKEKIKESRKRDRSEETAPRVGGKFHRPNGTAPPLQVGLEESGRH